MPGMIALYIETYAVTRFLHTDGRPVPSDPDPTFLGTSVAHWEGDTLVVDSRGFVDSTLLQIGALPARANDAPLVLGDCGRTSKDIGWKPKLTLESGLSATVDWWRAHLNSREG